jgi:hypothetical protein
MIGDTKYKFLYEDKFPLLNTQIYHTGLAEFTI